MCPQQYAYRWLYDIPDYPRTPQQWFLRVIRRTALTIVREILEKKTPTLTQAWLLLEYYSRGTVVRSDAKLAQRARTLIGQFNEYMHKFRIVSIGEVRLVTIPFRPRQASDVQLQADFTGFWKRQRTHVLLTPPSRPVEARIAGSDTQQWATMSIDLKSVGTITSVPQVSIDTTPAAALIWQGLRGLARKIVWPYRDRRCLTCVYTDGCTPADAHPQRLQTAKDRQQVRKRMSKTRSRKKS